MSLATTIARRPLHAAGACGLLLLAGAALLGAVHTPHDPLALDVASRLHAPSAAHWLGTDQFGRDQLSRLLIGAGVSLRVSIATVLLALLAGVLLGAVAGYFRGPVDRVIGGLVDAFLAMPGILLALALIAVMGASEGGVILALGLAYTPNVTRVVRGSVLSLRGMPYVEAARLFGHPHWFIIARHIVPNVVGPVTVLGSSYFAQALLSESVLSFLGLGVPPPHPSWGGLLAEGQAFIADAPWLSVFPGLAIALALLCINLTGDAVRDHFDPRRR